MNALARTRRRLDRWRASHRKRSRLPHALKAEACGLLEEHTPQEITKALRISAALFEKWQRVSGITDVAKPPAVKRRVKRVLPAFIDVTPVTSGLPVGASMLTVEVAGRGTIKLSGELNEGAVRAAVGAAFAAAPVASGEVVL